MVFTNQKELRAYLEPYIKNNTSVGLVPTMGALHQGHLSLLKESLKQTTITVVSVFVNPTQFNNQEDLNKYPRNLEKDTEKVEKIDQNIVIFAPTIDDIYGQNVVSTRFDYDGLEHQMEGKQRPGHFDGVGTIVKALFEIVQPTRAYFGEKDYQQTLIVKKMVEKHHLPVEIVVCPILREKNGLAMSSRNERLTPSQREKAGVIYQALLQAKELFRTKTHQEVYAYISQTFELEKDIELEYFSIADDQTLVEITEKQTTKQYRAFIAVNLGNVRLIDTIPLN